MKIINKYKNYLIILIVSLIIMIPFFVHKTIIGNDSWYHIPNIEALTKDILNFNFTKISGSIINGLGYGSNIFYPKLPHYSASIINIFIKNAKISINILIFLIVFLSGIFMYKLLNKIYKDKDISLLGSILYITSSFLIYQIFRRCCLNELFMYALFPIIFLSLEYLKEDNEKIFIILFSIGYICIIFSHLVLGLYFTFLVIIYLLFNYKIYLNKKNIIRFIKASIIILIITSPFLILLIEHKNTNLYVVFESYIMAPIIDRKDTSLLLKDFIIPYRRRCAFINIFEIICIIISTIYLFKDKLNKNRKNIITIGILLLISIFMSTKYFPYNYLPKKLLLIQFPMRCVSFVVFFKSIYSIYFLNFIKEITKKIIVIIGISFSIIVVFSIFSKDYIRVDNNYEKHKLSRYALGWQQEYLTIQGNVSKKYETKENKIISLNNNKVKIKEIENNTPKLIAKISNVKKTTTLELPRLYYLGYNIKYKTKTKTYKLNYKLDKNGFIKVNVKESGTIYVKYTGTILYNIFRIIRLIFIISLIIYLIKNKKIKIKE